jgi:hypothetical protein
MSQGRLVADGSVAELTKEHSLEQKFLLALREEQTEQNV